MVDPRGEDAQERHEDGRLLRVPDHRGLKMASREKMKQAMNYDPVGPADSHGDPPSRQAPANAPRHLERSPSAAPPQSACVRVRRDKNVSYKTATTTTTAA